MYRKVLLISNCPTIARLGQRLLVHQVMYSHSEGVLPEIYRRGSEPPRASIGTSNVI